VTAANVNDGTQAQAVLAALVVRPPAADVRNPAPEERDLPHARADGAYGNGPTRQRARGAGFRMVAPKQGRPRRKGLGRVRCAVERGHAWLAQFGRIARRWDRLARRYLGWVEFAACIIFVRAEAKGFFR
jgi:transposase